MVSVQQSNERQFVVPEPVRRIAVIRALQLGDLLVAVPAFRALRTAFPQAEITLFGLPWATEFVQRFDAYIDRFIEFPGFPGIPEARVDPERGERCFREARLYGYDLVIQMHGDGRVSNAFARLLGGRFTVGFESRHSDQSPLDAALPYDGTEHEIKRWLRLLQSIGSTSIDPQLEFPLQASDWAELEQLADFTGLARSNTPLLLIHPGARSPNRRWSAERFAAVGNELAHRLNGVVVITGTRDEEDTAAIVERHLDVPKLNLCGRTSLGGLAALISRAQLFVGNDSGPSHLAVAVGTPSLSVFGAADPRCWAPLDRTRHRVVSNPERSRCNHRCCSNHPSCLGGITAEAVIEAAIELTGDLAAEQAIEGLPVGRFYDEAS